MDHSRIYSQDEACQRTEEADPDFNVVIVYDSRSTATRAMNVFSGLVHQFGGDFEFHCDLWRFDVLGLPRVHEAAARAGAAADLLIVAARCDTDLPPLVREWLRRCIAGKTPGSAALVALLESHGSSGDTQYRTRQFLQSAADRRFLDFFLQEVDLPQTSLALTPEVLWERAGAQ